MKLISDKLSEIKNLPFERLYAFTKGGALIFTKDGTADEVQLTNEEFQKIKGKIVIHNHPGCTGNECILSNFDVEAAREKKIFQMISICSCGKIDSYTRRK